MIYGALHTYSLTDRAYAPSNCQPLAARILWGFEGIEGRAKLRKLLGKELEKSDQDIPGMRGFPLWMYVLDAGKVRLALPSERLTTLPAVYLAGPTKKKAYTGVEASKGTSGADAEIILRYLTAILF